MLCELLLFPININIIIGLILGQVKRAAANQNISSGQSDNDDSGPGIIHLEIQAFNNSIYNGVNNLQKESKYDM